MHGAVSHVSLPTNSGSDLTSGNAFPQDIRAELSEIVCELASEAQHGARSGSAVDAHLMAHRLTALAAAYTLHELRQLPQLEFLRHLPE